MDAAALYRDLAPKVLGYLRAQAAPDPEDLLGEVFLQVARDLGRFKGEGPDDARRWVFAIARNRLLDARRAARRRPATADGVPVPDTGHHLDPALPDPELVAALGRLTDDQREVVVLRFVADLSLDDVARLTGRKANAVKQLQHRALAALRSEMVVRQ